MAMMRSYAFALVSIGVAAAVASGVSSVSQPLVVRDDRTGPAEPSPTATIAYRPGEPALVLDNAATLTRSGDGHFSTGVSVNGQPIDMLVDTGASVVALTVADAQRLGLPVDPATFRVVGTGASGPVSGQAVILNDVAVGDRHIMQVEAVVLAGLGRSLLGQSWLRRLDRVQIDGDTMTLR